MLWKNSFSYFSSSLKSLTVCPNCLGSSVSHFCIGQSQISHLRVTAFRYCRLTPYLAKVNTGLYKRMRWNVERLQEQQDQQTDEEPGGKRQQCAAHTVGETD